eukprot:363892-Chlamydomonas_euryale.AAC.4
MGDQEVMASSGTVHSAAGALGDQVMASSGTVQSAAGALSDLLREEARLGPHTAAAGNGRATCCGTQQSLAGIEITRAKKCGRPDAHRALDSLGCGMLGGLAGLRPLFCSTRIRPAQRNQTCPEEPDLWASMDVRPRKIRPAQRNQTSGHPAQRNQTSGRPWAVWHSPAIKSANVLAGGASTPAGGMG